MATLRRQAHSSARAPVSTFSLVRERSGPGARAHRFPRASTACRDLVVRGRVGERTHHLHVNGRGQPEIKCLQPILGWLEEKREIRVLRDQTAGRLANIIARRTVILGLQ